MENAYPSKRSRSAVCFSIPNSVEIVLLVEGQVKLANWSPIVKAPKIEARVLADVVEKIVVSLSGPRCYCVETQLAWGHASREVRGARGRVEWRMWGITMIDH